MPVLSQGAVDPSDVAKFFAEKNPSSFSPCAVFPGTAADVTARYPGASIYGQDVINFPGCAGNAMGSGLLVQAAYQGFNASTDHPYYPVPLPYKFPCNARFSPPGQPGPHTGACVPQYVHQCQEAIYNRDTGSWTCSKFGPRCGDPGGYAACEPVPADALYVYVDDPMSPGGLAKQAADENGDPIFAPPTPAGTHSSSGGEAGIILLAAALAALLLLGN